VGWHRSSGLDPLQSLSRELQSRAEAGRPSMRFAGSSRTWFLAGFRSFTPRWGPAVVLHFGPVDSSYSIQVAGRWPSPLDLLGLETIPAEADFVVTYEVLPESCDIPFRGTWMSRALRDLHVLFEDASQYTLSSPADAFSRRGGRAEARLLLCPDRGPGTSNRPVRTPLLGLSKDCPFVDIRFERPLPGSFGPTQAPSLSHPSAWAAIARLVPSLSFHPTSTVSSARAPQACCILQPTMGFTAFPLVRRPQFLQSSRIAPSSSRHFHQRRCFPAVYGPRSPSRSTLRRFSLRRSRSWLSSSERGVLQATLPQARSSSLTSAFARVSGRYRALSSRSLSRGPSPPKWSGPGPSPLAVADPHLLLRWWLRSQRSRAVRSAPAGKRLASPLDLRVFFRDGVRCDHSRCQV